MIASIRSLFSTAVLIAILLILAAGILDARINSGALDRWVIGGGGSQAAAGGVALSGTIGQPLAYSAAGGSAELCAGFWCGLPGEYHLYLPQVIR